MCSRSVFFEFFEKNSQKQVSVETVCLSLKLNILYIYIYILQKFHISIKLFYNTNINSYFGLMRKKCPHLPSIHIVCAAENVFRKVNVF